MTMWYRGKYIIFEIESTFSPTTLIVPTRSASQIGSTVCMRAGEPVFFVSRPSLID